MCNYLPICHKRPPYGESYFQMSPVRLGLLQHQSTGYTPFGSHNKQPTLKVVHRDTLDPRNPCACYWFLYFVDRVVRKSSLNRVILKCNILFPMYFNFKASDLLVSWYNIPMALWQIFAPASTKSWIKSLLL